MLPGKIFNLTRLENYIANHHCALLPRTARLSRKLFYNFFLSAFGNEFAIAMKCCSRASPHERPPIFTSQLLRTIERVHIQLLAHDLVLKIATSQHHASAKLDEPGGELLLSALLDHGTQPNELVHPSIRFDARVSFEIV